MEINVNILPKGKKELIRKKKIFRLLFWQELVLVGVIVIFIGALSSINFILGIQKDIIGKSSLVSQTNEYKVIKEHEELFDDVNKKVAVAVKMKALQINWTNFFEEIVKILPKGIILNEIANADYKLIISGVATTREALLDFKSSLEESECFYDVNVPISNIVIREDVAFQVDFFINKKCLNE